MKNALAQLSIALSLLGTTQWVAAQTPPPAPVRSVEVNSDRTITFRYRDPLATSVTVGIDVVGKPTPMTKDDAGVWSVTTEPMAPEIYAYHFTVDGVSLLDTANPRFTPNLRGISNLIEVPGDQPQPWDAMNVPHGVVHHHTYNTATVLGLENNQSDYYVYTPPNYDAKAKKPYPVLYLLHGWSDDASGWTAVGQTHMILDNLLAQGKIKPMVVVMPLGYGDMSFVRDRGVWGHPSTVEHNVLLFQKALLTEVLPQVEAAYNVSRKREGRAIAGLSMGGLESLTTGLSHTDMFAYVGGFSSALHAVDGDKQFPSLNPKTADLKLLWIACGVDDQLMAPNREFIAWLKSRNMPVTPIETPGRHTWSVWRDNLINFTPLLFTDK
ncbi:MAG: esterase [Acidobacteria bacterium]|nr:esterase [Acidobacteriota bacterium]